MSDVMLKVFFAVFGHITVTCDLLGLTPRELTYGSSRFRHRGYGSTLRGLVPPLGPSRHASPSSGFLEGFNNPLLAGDRPRGRAEGRSPSGPALLWWCDRLSNQLQHDPQGYVHDDGNESYLSYPTYLLDFGGDDAYPNMAREILAVNLLVEDGVPHVDLSGWINAVNEPGTVAQRNDEYPKGFDPLTTDPSVMTVMPSNTLSPDPPKSTQAAKTAAL